MEYRFKIPDYCEWEKLRDGHSRSKPGTTGDLVVETDIPNHKESPGWRLINEALEKGILEYDN